MGNTVTLSETMFLALGALAIILAVLVVYSISLVSKLSRMIVEMQSGNNKQENVVQYNPTNNSVSIPQSTAQSFDESDDEEDRLVVALAASIMAGQDKPDSHFHISKIRRIK